MTKQQTVDLDAAEREADQARQRLADAHAQLAATAAATKAARDDATATFWAARKASYIKNYGGQIDAAKAAFHAAVRDGGDILAAWVAYRKVRVTVADEHAAFTTWHARRHDAALRAKLDQLGRLNTLAGHIDTTPRSERGQTWHDMVAEWKRGAAAYLGVGDPGEPRALPNDLPHFQMDRLSGLGGPQANDDADFTKAFAAAVRTVEAETVAAHEAERSAALRAMIDKATR